MSSNRHPNIAIVGATGVVGREMIALIEQRQFAFGTLRLLASERSAGQTVQVAGAECIIERLSDGCFDDVDIALLCASGDVSRAWAHKAVDAGAYVIDNSSAFRMEDDVPLVIPEINADALDAISGPAIIANPNCSTIIALMAVAPLHRACPVRRMVVATYQAASGGGAAMMAELQQQLAGHVEGKNIGDGAAADHRQFAVNVFCHESPIGADGSNEEEAKLERETHKILGDASIGVSATCVRVPVLRAHSEAINLTFDGSMTEETARKVLGAAPGVQIIDDRIANRFPEPIHAQGIDDVLVGRIRCDASQPDGRGLSLFVSGDQLRKGAALNAIQIAETLIARGMCARSAQGATSVSSS